MIEIKATYADNKTLEEFSRVLEKRGRYLHETSLKSVHAMAVETLKSLRALTRVAKASKIKVSLTPRRDLKFSYYTVGKVVKMCIRSTSGERINPGKTVYADVHGHRCKDVHVYEFHDDGAETPVTYIIAAKTRGSANKTARTIVARRVLRYAGLARRAMSSLMIKTNNRGPADPVAARVYRKANEVTKVRKITTGQNDKGGRYALVLEDNLRYAVRALKGGQSAVDLALKKAANKSMGLIKRRCKHLLTPGELATPFPEITKKAS